MTALLRFFKIAYLFFCYRINELIPKSVLPKWLVFLSILNPFQFSKKNKNSGQRLAEALEKAGPVFIKFGQILSTRPDFLEKEIVEELKKFQNNLKPFDSNTAKKIIESDLGKSIDELFANFNSEPLAAASIAQVHEAELHSGEKVVIKVVRPGLEKKIKNDLALLKALGYITSKFKSDAKRLKLKEMIKEYEYVITSEIDLKKEAGNTIQTKNFFQNNDLLYVPNTYLEFSGPRTLTLEKIDGIPVSDIETLKEKNVNLKLLSERGVSIFFKQLFEDNFFHADMHPGNIFVNASNPNAPSYVAVDYAICGSLSETEQLLIGKMLADMFSRNYAGVAKTMISAEWVDSETKPIELEVTIRTALDPIFEKPFSEIKFGEMLLYLFEETRIYNLSLPPSLLLLHKTLLNIEGLGRQIYPDLDLWSTAKPFIQQWVNKKYNPANLLKKFKKDAPSLLEKAYEFPEKLESIFENISNLDEFNDEVKGLRKEIETQKNSLKYLLITSAVIIISVVSIALSL